MNEQWERRYFTLAELLGERPERNWEHWYSRSRGTTLCGFNILHAADIALLAQGGNGHPPQICPDCARVHRGAR